MPINPDAVGTRSEPTRRRWSSKDSLIYALYYFGGIKAKQSIVCALMQGPESDYAAGEALCRAMFAPVERAHRVTVDQMIILEPVLSETTAATCITVIREARFTETAT